MTPPNIYRVTFDRIGRDHNVRPLIAVGDLDESLAGQISDYARGYIRSRRYDTYVEKASLTGIIIGGTRPFGGFTVADVTDEPRPDLIWAKVFGDWQTQHDGHYWVLAKLSKSNPAHGVTRSGWHLYRNPSATGRSDIGLIWIATQEEAAKLAAAVTIADIERHETEGKAS